MLQLYRRHSVTAKHDAGIFAEWKIGPYIEPVGVVGASQDRGATQ